MNDLVSLDNELPRNGQNLIMIHAAENRIERLPQDFKYLTSLESLFFHKNRLTNLDGTLSKSKNLETVQLDHNEITMVSTCKYTFECTSIDKCCNPITL